MRGVMMNSVISFEENEEKIIANKITQDIAVNDTFSKNEKEVIDKKITVSSKFQGKIDFSYNIGKEERKIKNLKRNFK